VGGHGRNLLYCVGQFYCEDATLCNGWSKEELRYAICKARGLGLGQELGCEDKVLELPKQRLGTRIIRENLSIKKSIQEVV
jgi:hypothetical protein